jgi:subtilase family serine protease
VSSVSGSSYRIIEKNITIPTNASTGLWYILFEAEANSQINEINESNNVGRYSVNIMTSANGPDLTITRAITNPISVYPGNPVTAEFDIKNIGREGRWGSINSGIYLSNDASYSSNDQLLTTYYFETIGAGQTRVCTKSVTIPEGTTPGTKYLIIRADHNNSIYETDENNNTRAIAITILDNTPAPDLIVQYPSAPSSATQGASISVSCRVRNQGNASASSSYVKVYLAGGNTSRWIRTYLGQIYTSSISAGSYRTVSGNVTIPASAFTGNKYLVFVADANSQINESDETNNDTYRAITINQGNAPDLETRSVSITSPGTVFPAGTTVTVSANIRNLGTANAGSTVVKYYLSQNTNYDSGDTYLASYNLSSLAAGSSQTFSKSITLSSTLIDDGYFILVRADANQQVDEADEFNNVDDVYFTIANGGEPDLTVENAALSPTTINEGGSTVASCRVRNIGSTYTQAGAGSGSGYSSFQLFLSSNTVYDSGDTYLTYQGVSNLAPNAYVNISKTLNIPAGITGQMYILFVADRYNGINESNENNNVAYIPLYIQAGGVIGKKEYNFRHTNITEFTKVALKAGQNPVVSQTTFTYNLPTTTKVSLGVYNLKGVQVANLINGETKTKGEHQVTFYRKDLPAGLYFYRFIANGKLITGKLVVK